MENETTSEWINRWRANRGSSPEPPMTGGFDVLRVVPRDAIDGIAAATGDDIDRVAWWCEIADRELRDDLAVLRDTQIPIYRALLKHGPMTDDELVDELGIKKSSVSPRRKDLVKLGLVRAVEHRVTDAGRKAQAWGIVPADEVDEARNAALALGPRRMKVDKWPLEWRLQLVRHLVRMDDVNEALLGDRIRSKANDRARAAAQEVHRQRDRERREENERIRDAEREASPRLNFFKAIRRLRQAGDAVREIGRVMDEAIDEEFEHGYSEIPRDDWPEVRIELRKVIDLASETDHSLGRIVDDEHVIVLEDEGEVAELPPADTVDAEPVEDENV